MLNKKTLFMLTLSLTFLLTAAACGGPAPVEPSLSGDAEPSQSAPAADAVEPSVPVIADAQPSPSVPDTGTPEPSQRAPVIENPEPSQSAPIETTPDEEPVQTEPQADTPAGIIQTIYDQLAGADQITVELSDVGSWTGSPGDFGLPDLVSGWEWTENIDTGTSSGSGVSAVEWMLTVSAGETYIRFYSGSDAAACAANGELLVLYAIGPEDLAGLMYARATELLN